MAMELLAFPVEITQSMSAGKVRGDSQFIHDVFLSIYGDINFSWFVIPGLTRNPVFSWIPAFAGMTGFVVINDTVYNFLW
jgi:hypothetical protein